MVLRIKRLTLVLASAICYYAMCLRYGQAVSKGQMGTLISIILYVIGIILFSTVCSQLIKRWDIKQVSTYRAAYYHVGMSNAALVCCATFKLQWMAPCFLLTFVFAIPFIGDYLDKGLPPLGRSRDKIRVFY